VDLKVRATDTLKEGTQKQHRMIDRHPLMHRVVAKDLTRVEYGQILAALYRWHELLTPMLSSLKLDPDFYALDKLLMLERDLSSLPGTQIASQISSQISSQINSQINTQIMPLQPSDEAFALGVLYVVEGSTLGAQFIAPRVELSLRSRQLTHYYRMYGDAVWANWTTTQRILNQRLNTDALAQRALMGANEAFALLLNIINTQTSEFKCEALGVGAM